MFKTLLNENKSLKNQIKLLKSTILTKTNELTLLKIKLNELQNKLVIECIEPIVETVFNPIIEINIEPIVETIFEPITETIIEPIIEPIIELIIEPIIEPIFEQDIEPIFETIIEQDIEPADDELPIKNQTVIRQHKYKCVLCAYNYNCLKCKRRK